MENTKSKSKSKTSEKARKATVASKAVKTGKTKAVESSKSEDEIRMKAQEIYTERVARGENGSAENDWLQAEKMLKG